MGCDDKLHIGKQLFQGRYDKPLPSGVHVSVNLVHKDQCIFVQQRKGLSCGRILPIIRVCSVKIVQSLQQNPDPAKEGLSALAYQLNWQNSVVGLNTNLLLISVYFDVAEFQSWSEPADDFEELIEEAHELIRHIPLVEVGEQAAVRGSLVLVSIVEIDDPVFELIQSRINFTANQWHQVFRRQSLETL